MQDMRDGKRKKFDPEVWLARSQRAAVVIDKEVAVIEEYGNEPNAAAQAILMNYDKYKDITEDFDMAFAAQEFLDQHLFDGKYAAWRNEIQDDNMSLLSELNDRLRFLQDSVDATVDILEYMDLDPQEERRIRGMLSSGIRELTDAIAELERRDTEDQPWLGNRDRVLVKYWTDVATPYHEGRTKIFEEEINVAKNSRDRSIAFDNLRLYDNEHFGQKHFVEGYQGVEVNMPNEMLRAWNTKPRKEKEERILSLMDKKSEWLNMFQIGVLVEASPRLVDVLMTEEEDWQVYDQVNDEIRALQEIHQAEPGLFTESQLEKREAELKAARDKWLIENGRGNEVAWRDFVPAQRLEYADLLPETIQGMMPQLHTVLDYLRAADKSPTSNLGEQSFLMYAQWLEQQYFPQHPGAEEDLAELGRAMFDEGLQSAVFARFFQGDRFGKLE